MTAQKARIGTEFEVFDVFLKTDSHVFQPDSFHQSCVRKGDSAQRLDLELLRRGALDCVKFFKRVVAPV